MKENEKQELRARDWSIAAIKIFALFVVIGVCLFIKARNVRGLDALMWAGAGFMEIIYCLTGIVFSFVFGIAARYIKISVVEKKALLVSFSAFVFYLLLYLLLFLLIFIYKLFNRNVVYILGVNLFDVQGFVLFGSVITAIFMPIFIPIYVWLMERKVRELEVDDGKESGK